jgi:hypothetical protein
MKIKVLFIGALTLLAITNAYAVKCEMIVQNELENVSDQGPKGKYTLSPLSVAMGTCAAPCTAPLNYGQSVTIINDGTSYNTTLTTSAQLGDVNAGSVIVSMANANTSCTLANISVENYWCSTNPSSGKANCKIVGEKRAPNTVILRLEMTSN